MNKNFHIKKLLMATLILSNLPLAFNDPENLTSSKTLLFPLQIHDLLTWSAIFFLLRAAEE